MESVRTFEDLEVWQQGMHLSKHLYTLLKDCRDYGFRDQIQRAAVSIPCNIAEGYERQTNKEYIQFLFIAKGSCGEVRTQLYLAKELGYISDEIASDLLIKAKQISSMLFKLIQTRQTSFQ